MLKHKNKFLFFLTSSFSLIISFISMIISIYAFSREQVVFNLNFINKDFFVKAIKDDKLTDIDNIKKIAIGQGWHSGELYIYRHFQKKQTICITEGNHNFTNTQEFIKKYGHSLDIEAFLFFIISIIAFIIPIIIFCITNKKRLS